MAFTSGQWGPDTFIDSAGNTTLIGATVTAAGYVCTVDALGNLTIVGPADDSLTVTVTPATGTPYTAVVAVKPTVDELDTVRGLAVAAETPAGAQTKADAAEAAAEAAAAVLADAAEAAAVATAAVDATTKANAAQAAAEATAAADATAKVAAQAASDTATFEPKAADGWVMSRLVDQAAYATLYGTTAPAAVYDPVSDKTFLAYLGVSRALWVAAVDHATGLVEGPFYVAPMTVGEEDDSHGSPSIVIDLTGTLHIAFGAHNGKHLYTYSSSARDITAWAAVETFTLVNGTYSNLIVDPVSGDLFMVDRSGHTHDTVFPSHEYAGIRRRPVGTGVWSSPTAIIDSQDTPEAASDVYLGSISFGPDDLLHITWGLARGAAHDSTRIGVYHATYNPVDGKMRNLAGTDLGDTVTWADHASCQVTDAQEVWVRRHYFDADDTLHIAYAWEDGGVGKVSVATHTGGGAFDITLTPAAPRYGAAQVEITAGADDGTLRLLCSGIVNDLGLSDIVEYTSPVTTPTVWTYQGVVARGTEQEGFERVQAPRGASAGSLLAQVNRLGRGGSEIPTYTTHVVPLYALDYQPGAVQIAAGVDRETIFTARDRAYGVPGLDENGRMLLAHLPSSLPAADATRIWIPALAFYNGIVGTPALGVSNRTVGWLLDSASTEIIGTQVDFPAGWTTYDATVYWANAGAGSGNVGFRCDVAALTAGVATPAGGTGSAKTRTAGLQNIIVTSSLFSAAATAPDGPANFQVLRLGADAADTLANDCIVIGVLLTKVT